MPLNDFKKIYYDSKPRRLTVADNLVYSFPKYLFDEADDTLYPVQVLKDLVKYFSNLYGRGVVGLKTWKAKGDSSIAKGYLYYPRSVTSEQMLNDFTSFLSKYNGEVTLTYEKLREEKNRDREYPEAANYYKLNHKFNNKTKQWYEETSRLEVAKKKFILKYGRPADENSEEDRQELVNVYNEFIDESRAWSTFDFTLHFKNNKFSPRIESTNIDLMHFYVSDSKNKIKDYMKKSEETLYWYIIDNFVEILNDFKEATDFLFRAGGEQLVNLLSNVEWIDKQCFDSASKLVKVHGTIFDFDWYHFIDFSLTENGRNGILKNTMTVNKLISRVIHNSDFLRFKPGSFEKIDSMIIDSKNKNKIGDSKMKNKPYVIIETKSFNDSKTVADMYNLKTTKILDNFVKISGDEENLNDYLDQEVESYDVEIMRDSANLSDSTTKLINKFKKLCKDAVELSNIEGTLANVLLKHQNEFMSTASKSFEAADGTHYLPGTYENLRNVLLKVLDDPEIASRKAPEKMKRNIEEMNKEYSLMRPGMSQADLMSAYKKSRKGWERLLMYIYNVIAKADGQGVLQNEKGEYLK